MDINFSGKLAATILSADYIALKREGTPSSETMLPVIKLQGFGLKLE
jgi:DNA-binding phage protein